MFATVDIVYLSGPLKSKKCMGQNKRTAGNLEPNSGTVGDSAVEYANQ